MLPWAACSNGIIFGCVQARCVARTCDMLSHLRSICEELGEDVGMTAGEAHPSLRTIRYAVRKCDDQLPASYGLCGSLVLT
jgi:hypothetical protein